MKFNFLFKLTSLVSLFIDFIWYLIVLRWEAVASKRIGDGELLIYQAGYSDITIIQWAAGRMSGVHYMHTKLYIVARNGLSNRRQID